MFFNIFAELGKGRVVIFSHSTLLDGFEKKNTFGNMKFNTNVIRWVTKGANDSNKIQNLERYVGNIETLSENNKVLTWDGWQELTTEEMNHLFEWIENGGAHICGCCPRQILKVKNVQVSCLPLSQILSKIGTAFAGKMNFKKDTGNKVLMADNLGHLSKLSSLIEAIKTQPEVNEYLFDTLVDHVHHLPDELFIQHESTFLDLIRHFSPNNEHVPTKKTPVEFIHLKRAAILLVV